MGDIDAKFCEHANEAPQACSCPLGCYCRGRTCPHPNDNAKDATGVALTKDRAKLIPGTAKRKAEAFRERAGRIGQLTACICTYPLDTFETVSGHHEACPSEGVARSMVIAKERADALAQAADEPPPWEDS
jgi:hypothetical protein